MLLFQALLNCNISATPPQNSTTHQQNVMSWNNVVSGNQFGKSPTIGRGDLMEPCTVNTKEIHKDPSSVKSQKPSPIFGNQQKHAVKKPTAHVKPLKCNPPAALDVQTPSASVNVNTGSRVSELDDFSADLPVAAAIPHRNLNMTANVVSNSFVDYPPVAAQVSGVSGSGKSKKKKKKGKDQVGLVSEVK